MPDGDDGWKNGKRRFCGRKNGARRRLEFGCLGKTARKPLARASGKRQPRNQPETSYCALTLALTFMSPEEMATSGTAALGAFAAPAAMSM